MATKSSSLTNIDPIQAELRLALIDAIKLQTPPKGKVYGAAQGREFVHFYGKNKHLFLADWNERVANAIKNTVHIEPKILREYSVEVIKALEKDGRSSYIHADIIKEAIRSAGDSEKEDALFSLLPKYEIAYLKEQAHVLKGVDAKNLQIFSTGSNDFFSEYENARRLEEENVINEMLRGFSIETISQIAAIVQKLINTQAPSSSDFFGYHLDAAFSQGHSIQKKPAYHPSCEITGEDLCKLTYEELIQLHRAYKRLPVSLVRAAIAQAKDTKMVLSLLHFLPQVEINSYREYLKESEGPGRMRYTCSSVHRFLRKEDTTNDFAKRLRLNGIDSASFFDRKSMLLLKKREIVALLKATYFIDPFELFMAISECPSSDIAKALSSLYIRVCDEREKEGTDTREQVAQKPFESQKNEPIEVGTQAQVPIVFPVVPQDEPAITNNTLRTLASTIDERYQSIYPLMPSFDATPIFYTQTQAHQLGRQKESIALQVDSQFTQVKNKRSISSDSESDEEQVTTKTAKRKTLPRSMPVQLQKLVDEFGISSGSLTILVGKMIPRHMTLRSESEYLTEYKKDIAQAFSSLNVSTLYQKISEEQSDAFMLLTREEKRLYKLLPIAEYIIENQRRYDTSMQFFTSFELAEQLSLIEVMLSRLETREFLTPFVESMVDKCKRLVENELTKPQAIEFLEHMYKNKKHIQIYAYIWKVVEKQFS